MRHIINAVGTMTYLGSSRVSPRVAEAMNGVLPAFVELRELQCAVSRAISAAAGSKVGCETAARPPASRSQSPPA